MKVYLDTCCYCRPYDDQTQVKIAAETVAVMAAIETCRLAGFCIVGSMVVMSELGNIRSDELREIIEQFYTDTVDYYVLLTADDLARAKELQFGGMGVMDSYHLAAAETAGVNILLTTDGSFERIRIRSKLSAVKVINPLIFLPEVMNEYDV